MKRNHKAALHSYIQYITLYTANKVIYTPVLYELAASKVIFLLFSTGRSFDNVW